MRWILAGVWCAEWLLLSGWAAAQPALFAGPCLMFTLPMLLLGAIVIIGSLDSVVASDNEWWRILIAMGIVTLISLALGTGAVCISLGMIWGASNAS